MCLCSNVSFDPFISTSQISIHWSDNQKKLQKPQRTQVEDICCDFSEAASLIFFDFSSRLVRDVIAERTTDHDLTLSGQLAQENEREKTGIKHNTPVKSDSTVHGISAGQLHLLRRRCKI